MSYPIQRSMAAVPPGFRLVPTAQAGGFPAGGGGGGGGMMQAGGAMAGCGGYGMFNNSCMPGNPNNWGPNGPNGQGQFNMYNGAAGNPALQALLAQYAANPGSIDGNLLQQLLASCCQQGPCNTFFARQQGPCSFPLGFTRTTILAGTTVNIVATPQYAYQGKCLIIPSDIAGQVLVIDLKVGQQSQLVGTGPLPGRGFSEASEAQCTLDLDPAQINQPITLTILNTSAGSIDFTAMMIGYAWRC